MQGQYSPALLARDAANAIYVFGCRSWRQPLWASCCRVGTIASDRLLRTIGFDQTRRCRCLGHLVQFSVHGIKPEMEGIVLLFLGRVQVRLRLHPILIAWLLLSATRSRGIRLSFVVVLSR